MAAGINEVIEGLFTELMPAAKEAVVLPAQIITVVAIILHVFNGLAEEGTLEKLKDNWLKTLIPPLIVAFLVFNYGMMFDYILEIFKALDKETMSFSDQTSIDLENLREEKAKIAKNARETSTGFLDSLSDNIGLSFLIDKIDGAIEMAIHLIIELIYLAVYILYKMMSFLNIYFLCMFGPLQVALYFTPWYRGSLPDWFGKLISALMWMPILNIVKMVVEKIQIYFIKIDMGQLSNANGTTGSTIGQDDWLEYVAVVVGIFMMSQVSNFASFILSSSGIGGENGMFGKVIGGSASAVGSGMASSAGAVAGTVAGPIGSMVGGITKGVAKGAIRGAGKVAGGISNIFS
jgi:hypothetical protein